MDRHAGTIKILLVGQNPATVKTIKDIASERNEGHLVLESVSQPQEAFEILRRNSTDLVLFDSEILINKGFDELDRLLSGASSVPVIVLTDGDGEKVALEALRRGARDYLRKEELGAKIFLRVVRHALERGRTEAVLKEAERRLHETLSNVNLIAIQSDTKGTITFCNDYLLNLTGWRREEVIGRNWFDMFLPVDIRERVRSAFHEVIGGERPAFVNYESPIVTKDGERRLVLWNNIVLRDTQGGVIGTSSIGEDITERKRAEQELQKLSAELMRVSKKFKKIDLKDPHTGLYNNRYLEEVIDREFSRAQRYASPISLMMLDVDYFKSINDLYGHLFGDLVLKQLAHLLKKLVRRYDIVVRYGGEEFVVISPGTDSQGALLMGQRLFDIIGVYNFGNKKNSVKLKISLAIASYPEDGIGKGIDLIRTAERILDKAKADGGNKIYSSQDTKKEKRAEVSEGARPEGVKYLKDKIDNLTKRANQNLMAAVFAFAKTIELKDHYTGSHVEETVYYSREIARELDLPKVETEQVKQAAILHDLGKIGISERILLKKGKLTKKEFAEIKKHPVIAADIIRPIHFLKEIVPMVLHHHERWDGKGYPTGLKGEEIPIGARIIAIADVYQALTSDRPYRKAFSKKEAVRIIKNGSGTQFDPKVVDVFLKVLKRTNTKKFK